jgi:hypothetical protein
MSWVVVASHVDGVRVDLLSIIIVPDTVAVVSVVDDSGRSVVDDVSVVLGISDLILRPCAMSPVAVAWIVVSINIGDEHVVLIVPVSVSPVSVAWVIVTIDVAHESVVLVVEVATSPVSMSRIVVTIDV